MDCLGGGDAVGGHTHVLTKVPGAGGHVPHVQRDPMRTCSCGFIFLRHLLMDVPPSLDIVRLGAEVRRRRGSLYQRTEAGDTEVTEHRRLTSSQEPVTRHNSWTLTTGGSAAGKQRFSEDCCIKCC